MGQLPLAASAAFLNAAASIPGTVPLTVICEEPVFQPPSICSKVTVTLVSSFSGGVPASPRMNDSSML
jgi:hypothetical protein